MDCNAFDVYFKFINLNENKKTLLKYEENNKEKIYEIQDIELNIAVKSEKFSFQIINEEEQKNYTELLLPNYYNEIAIDLEKNEKGCNAEFVIKNIKGKYFKYLNILTNGIRYNFKTEYNNLNLSRIIIYNIPLGFNIFLSDKIKENNFLEKQKKSINSIKNEINLLRKKRSRFETKKERDELSLDNKEKNKEQSSNESSESEEEFEKDIYKQQFEEKEKNIEIEYSLKNMGYENLLFCIKDDYDITLTIHNMNENNNIIDNIIKQNIDKTSFVKYIEEGTSCINKLRNILKLNTFDCLKNEANEILNKYNKIDFEVYELSLLENDFFDENHYLLSLKSFFTHLIIIICELIIGLIDSYTNSNSKIDNISKEKILKEILIQITKKFDLFKDYVEYFNTLNTNNNQKIIENLKLFKSNLTYKEKAQYLSCILMIILMSPKSDINNNIQFFEIKDNNKDIYSQVKKFIYKIIDKLDSDSAYINGLELITSRIKEDLNQINDIKFEKDESKKTFILEMRTIEELKKTIKNFFPKIIVRIFDSQCSFNAHIDNYSGLMIINENIYEENTMKKMICKNDDNKSFKEFDKIIKGLVDLKNEKNYELYNLFIFKAFWRVNHECFGHLPVLEINNKKCDTPTKFIDKGDFINSNDAGKILEYFINKNEDRIDDIKNINCNVISLLKDELFVGKDFSLLWKKFRELEKNNNKKDMEINLSPEVKFMVEMLNEYDGIVNLKGEKRKIMKEKTIKREFHVKRRFKI